MSAFDEQIEVAAEERRAQIIARLVEIGHAQENLVGKSLTDLEGILSQGEEDIPTYGYTPTRAEGHIQLSVEQADAQYAARGGKDFSFLPGDQSFTSSFFPQRSSLEDTDPDFSAAPERVFQMIQEMPPDRVRDLQMQLFTAGYYGSTGGQRPQDRRAVNAQPIWGSADPDTVQALGNWMEEAHFRGRPEDMDGVLRDKLRVESQRFNQWYDGSGSFIGQAAIELPDANTLDSEIRARAERRGLPALSDEQVAEARQAFVTEYAQSASRRAAHDQRAIPSRIPEQRRVGEHKFNEDVARSLANRFGTVLYAGKRDDGQAPTQQQMYVQVTKDTDAVSAAVKGPRPELARLEELLGDLGVGVSRNDKGHLVVDALPGHFGEADIDHSDDFGDGSIDLPGVTDIEKRGFDVADSESLMQMIRAVTVQNGITIDDVTKAPTRLKVDGPPAQTAEERAAITSGRVFEMAGDGDQIKQMQDYIADKSFVDAAFLSDDDGDGVSDRIRVTFKENAEVPPDLVLNTGSDRDLEQLLHGIRMEETGGRYLDGNAYGWNERTYKSMAERFGVDPENTSQQAQDEVALAAISSLYDRYGDYELVAAAWRGGTGLADRALDDRALLRRASPTSASGSVGMYVDNVFGYMSNNPRQTMNDFDGTAGSTDMRWDSISGTLVPAGVRIQHQELSMESLMEDTIGQQFEPDLYAQALFASAEDAQDTLDRNAARARRFS